MSPCWVSQAQPKAMNLPHCIQPKSEQFKMHLNLLINIQVFNTAVSDLM